MTVWRGDAPASSPRIENVSRPESPSEAAPSPGLNWIGRMPMPTRLERWMRSKLSARTALTPRSDGPFAAQSRDDPEPYSRPAMTMSGTPSAM